jgi:hypothetical protein
MESHPAHGHHIGTRGGWLRSWRQTGGGRGHGARSPHAHLDRHDQPDGRPR